MGNGNFPFFPDWQETSAKQVYNFSAFPILLDVKNCACFVVCIYGLEQKSLKKRAGCRCNRWERDFSMFCGDE